LSDYFSPEAPATRQALLGYFILAVAGRDRIIAVR